MRHLKNFAVNERRSDGFFEVKMDSGSIDVAKYDKMKYEAVDTISAKLVWEEDIDYSNGGIDGIGAVVHELIIMVTYNTKGDDEKLEDEEFVIAKKDIEVKTSTSLPFYANEIEVDLVSRKCVVSFGS